MATPEGEATHSAEVALIQVTNAQGHLLLGKRNDTGKWTLPGGHLEHGESPERGAIRELFEETGLKPESLTYARKFSPHDGLTIHCFTALCLGDPHGDNDPDNECDKWEWVDVSDGIPEDMWENLAGPKNGNVVKQVFDQSLTKMDIKEVHDYNSSIDDHVPPPTSTNFPRPVKDNPHQHQIPAKPMAKVVHKTSLAQLNLYDREFQGYIPAPSLAIVHQDKDFDSFGDVTLIAHPRMVDPRVTNTHVYSGDSYSPRSGKPIWRSGLEANNSFASEVHNDPTASDTDRGTSRYSKESFAREFGEYFNSHHSVSVFHQGLLAVPGSSSGDVPRMVVDRFYAEHPLVGFGERGLNHQYLFDNWLSQKMKASGWQRKFSSSSSDGAVEDSDPETILRRMNRRPTFGGESHLTHASARKNPTMQGILLETKKFRSLNEIKAHTGQLIGHSGIEDNEEKINEQTQTLRDSLTADASKRGSTVTDEDIDHVVRGVHSGKYRTAKKAVQAILGGDVESKFPEVSGRIEEIIKLSTKRGQEYFEAKPRRLVHLSEFHTAVVPPTIFPEQLATLKRYGLNVVKQDANPSQVTNIARDHNLLLSEHSIDELQFAELQKSDDMDIEWLAKAMTTEDEVSTLLQHHDPMERRLALRLNTATPSHIRQGAFDADEEVWKEALAHPDSAIAKRAVLACTSNDKGEDLWPQQQHLLADDNLPAEALDTLYSTILHDNDIGDSSRKARLNEIAGHPNFDFPTENPDQSLAKHWGHDLIEGAHNIHPPTDSLAPNQAHNIDRHAAYKNDFDSHQHLVPVKNDKLAQLGENKKVIHKTKVSKYMVKPWTAGESISQQVFHAAGMGHIHQKSFTTEYVDKKTGKGTQATVIKIEPFHSTIASLNGWGGTGRVKHPLPDEPRHDPDDFIKGNILDAALGQNDRHLNNIMIDDISGKPLYIDSDACGKSIYGNWGEFKDSVEFSNFLSHSRSHLDGHLAKQLLGDRSEEAFRRKVHRLVQTWWPTVSEPIKAKLGELGDRGRSSVLENIHNNVSQLDRLVRGKSEDGSESVNDENGARKEWRNVEGLIHRDGDLPAIIRQNGENAYYKNGKRHRDGDLPAILGGPDGGVTYYKNGLRHRDGDQPAHKDKDAEAHYRNGQLHRDGGLPAVVHANGRKEWYEGGLHHRDGDLPAIEYEDGGKEYLYRGVRGRNGEDKPSIIRNGTETYYMDDLIHRMNDLPSVIGPGREEYFRLGRPHRDGGLPAVVVDKPGGVKEHHYYLHGVPYRPLGLPTYDDGAGYQEWRSADGLLHRLDGPAVIKGAVGEAYEEHYYKDGKLHREDGPAIFRRDGGHEFYEKGVQVFPTADGYRTLSSGLGGIKLKELRNKSGDLHSKNDLPAYIKIREGERGKERVIRKEWHKEGKVHRDGDLPAIELSDGTKFWYKDGLPHRDGGLPAIERLDGSKEWHVNGKRHRDNDLPAIEQADGSKEWFVNGKRHRDGDLPAVEWQDGHKAWYENGQPHRDGGLPAVEWADGHKEWKVNGYLHRDGDLPAIERPDGARQWYVRGKRHRDNDLPAIEWPDGTRSWWVDGQHYRDGGLPTIERAGIPGVKKALESGWADNLHSKPDQMPTVFRANDAVKKYKQFEGTHKTFETHEPVQPSKALFQKHVQDSPHLIPTPPPTSNMGGVENKHVHEFEDDSGAYHRFLIKGYHSNYAMHSGFGELMSQDAYHAGNIGHLHQKSFATTDDQGNPALVIHMDHSRNVGVDDWPEHAEDYHKIAMMDFLLQNGDRHGDNIMSPPLAIDNAASSYMDFYGGNVPPTQEELWKDSDALERIPNNLGTKHSPGIKEWWNQNKVAIKDSVHRNFRKVLPDDDGDVNHAHSRLDARFDDLDSSVNFKFGQHTRVSEGVTNSLNEHGLAHSFDDQPALIMRGGGLKIWMKNGVKHRDGGLPAYVEDDGYEIHYKDGKVHRDGGLPAIEYADGGKEWHVNGKIHRDNGLPAVERADGTKEWWENGKRHRYDGLPAVVRADGHKEWHWNGHLHRNNDLPAIEWTSGGRSYYKDGKLHRDGGQPAKEQPNGNHEWWVDGKNYPKPQ